MSEGRTPTIAIDTNALEPNDDAPNLFADKLRASLDGKLILLPDAVAGEIFSGRAWDKYAIDRIASLYPYMRHVFGGMSLAFMLRQELETGESIKELLHERETTERLRIAIRDCARAPREALRHFTSVRHHAVEEMDRRAKAVYRFRKKADAVVDDLRKRLTPQKLQQVCDHPQAFPNLVKSARLFGLIERTMRLMKQKEPGLGKAFNTRRMARRDCVWTRYFITHFAYAVLAHAQNRYSERSVRRLRSDHIDQEVIVTGSFADELLTNDQRAKRIDGMLRDAVSKLFD